MKRIALAALLALTLSLSAHAAPEKKKPVPTLKPAAEKQVTVYVTNTGKKYHREGCRSVSRSKIPILLEDAKKSYEPCKICNPPE